MADTASRFLARYDRPPPAAFTKAQADASKLTFRSLLTYPCTDLAGDYVVPAGCDFGPHRADPAIDLEHGRDPYVKGRPVAWARASFEDPGAPYAVEMVRLNFADPGKPDDWHTVPVGTEYFKSADRVSMQVFALREQGILPAASLEFDLVPGCFKAIGWSELERRKAYHFDRVAVRRWTVCARGVNPGALTIGKSLPAERAEQVPPALAKILSDKRVNVGGLAEPLCEVIYKALSARPLPDLSAGSTGPPQRTTVPVEKAMQQTQTGTADADLATSAETGALEDAQSAAPAKPTVQAHYDFAQGLIDLIDMAETQLQASEHLKGKAFLQKKLEQIRALAEDVKAMGDKIDGELAGKKPADGDEEEPVGKPIDTDDDGVMKGIRAPYKKAIKRFTLADLAAAGTATATHNPNPPPAADPTQVAALASAVERLSRKLKFI
jgi:hypothetical protein